MKLSGRIIEQDGKHYLLFVQAETARALPVRENAAGEWELDLEALGGVWGEHKPNAQGGTDCVIHVPALRVNAAARTPGETENKET